MPFSEAGDIRQAACGSKHTLLLTKDGKIYSCGNNDHGQIGHILYRKRPRMSLFRMLSQALFIPTNFINIIFYFNLF